MLELKLEKGMIFCSRNPMLLGRAINFVQKAWAKDDQSEYSHSGIIVKGGNIEDCISFEALWTNHQQNFYKAYQGKKVLIGRHIEMTPERFQKGWNGIRKHEGKWYAGHRLPLFFIPFLAKYANFGLGVCSELTAKFLFKAELLDYWTGVNPDDVADIIHRWRAFEVVFQDVLN